MHQYYTTDRKYHIIYSIATLLEPRWHKENVFASVYFSVIVSLRVMYHFTMFAESRNPARSNASQHQYPPLYVRIRLIYLSFAVFRGI